jgi:hypothetical protein
MLTLIHKQKNIYTCINVLYRQRDRETQHTPPTQRVSSAVSAVLRALTCIDEACENFKVGFKVEFIDRW